MPNATKNRQPRYTVEVLREQWIEAMINDGVGRFEIHKWPPRTPREVMARAKANRPPEPGKYFPVSREDVDAARDVMLSCGVTFRTYMNWHLLRRNYEANPAKLKYGPSRKVERDPLPCMSLWLGMNLRKPGMTLQQLAEMLDRPDVPQTEAHQILRQEIADIFTDIRRRLWPRRSRRRKAMDGGQ